MIYFTLISSVGLLRGLHILLEIYACFTAPLNSSFHDLLNEKMFSCFRATSCTWLRQPSLGWVNSSDEYTVYTRFKTQKNLSPPKSLLCYNKAGLSPTISQQTILKKKKSRDGGGCDYCCSAARDRNWSCRGQRRYYITGKYASQNSCEGKSGSRTCPQRVSAWVSCSDHCTSIWSNLTHPYFSGFGSKDVSS